jgi:FliI/YscN family ATPase
VAVAVAGMPAPLGATVEIHRETAGTLPAEVIGFKGGQTLVVPLHESYGVRPGDRVRLSRTSPWLRVGPGLLGRVVDAFGNPLDGQPAPLAPDRAELYRAAVPPLKRATIVTPLSTGVRAIDALVTCGRGQRMGIFSGSGVGKSVLLGMMARYTSADVIVVGLVGERGREVREFLESDLGPEGLARSVVVVATSDEPSPVRVRAANTATAVAEYFRDQGRDVLLLMDSLTRYALALREIGLAAGEPPATRAFPPSVFAALPKLLERAGRAEKGSITAFYSVLVDADDIQDPIGDCVRGLIDGHTWLSRKLANRAHWPAVDALESISRLMPAVTDREHQAAAAILRQVMAAYREHEDLISIGAYRRGNPLVDLAIDAQGEINAFLRQAIEERSSVEAGRQALLQMTSRWTARLSSPPPKESKSG